MAPAVAHYAVVAKVHYRGAADFPCGRNDVYRLGMESRKFSEATAAGLFQSAIGLVLVLVTNYIAKKIDPESGIM